MDLGLAVPPGTRAEQGRLWGSPVYMSPEHVGLRPVDGRSDRFSLGCVLFELLTGRRCIQKDARLRFADAGALAEALSSLGPAAPGAVAALLEPGTAEPQQPGAGALASAAG